MIKLSKIIIPFQQTWSGYKLYNLNKWFSNCGKGQNYLFYTKLLCVSNFNTKNRVIFHSLYKINYIIKTIHWYFVTRSITTGNLIWTSNIVNKKSFNNLKLFYLHHLFSKNITYYRRASKIDDFRFVCRSKYYFTSNTRRGEILFNCCNLSWWLYNV